MLSFLAGHGGQLFVYLQTIQSYLAPPACAVFLIGMTWPRLTEAGALSSMVIGLVLGGTRLIMDVVYPQPHCGEVDNRPGFVKLHFMYYGKVLPNIQFLLSSLQLRMANHFTIEVHNYTCIDCITEVCCKNSMC